MKLLLLFLTSLSCLGQAVLQNAVLQNAVLGAGGGGGGGSPGVYSMATNKTEAASIAITSDAGTAANRLSVAVISCNVGDNPVAGVTNADGTAYTQLVWTNYGLSRGMSLWYLVNPPTGSKEITAWAASSGRWIVFVVAITNAAQSSTFNTPAWSYTPADVYGTTNTPASASGELVLGACTIAESGDEHTHATVGPSQTLLGWEFNFWNLDSAISSQPGSGSVTDTFTWDMSDYQGGISVSIKPP